MLYVRRALDEWKCKCNKSTALFKIKRIIHIIGMNSDIHNL